MPHAEEPLRIGSIALEGRALLAPMSGVTDAGFRRIARRFGASLVVSEMVASRDLATRAAEAMLRAEGGGLDTHVVQLAGCEPRWMAEAARVAEGAGAAIVDINMGCPARRVVGGLAGSALMRDLDHALAIITATVGAVRVPVTLKMRLGWDDATLNAPALARRAEEAGIALVTVHGRTRAQFYKGAADWSAIAAVKRAVRVPVVANGDCATLDDARAMRRASGADAVMVGRAALGRPWLVGQIARGLDGASLAAPPVHERRTAALDHLDGLLTALGAGSGLRHARKHLAAYADARGSVVPPGLRRLLVTTDNPTVAAASLAAVFDEAPRGLPA